MFLVPQLLASVSAIAIVGPLSPVVSQDFLTDTTPPAWLNYSGIAGNRMMYDSTGKLTYAPNNIALYSRDLSNAYWASAYNSGVTRTATSITFTSSTGYIYGTVSGFIAGVKYIISATISNGTKGGTVLFGPLSSSLVVPLTSTPTRYSTIFTATANTAQIGFENRVAQGGDGLTGSVNITDIQIEAVTYETSPRAFNVTTNAAYYGPRFDYDPSTLAAKGLLIEESRTNAVLWAGDLTNAVWVKTNATALLNQTGPDGVANSAATVTATAANATVLQSITLASSQRFQTAFVRRVTGSGVVNMTTDGGATWTPITVTAVWTRVSIPAQTVTNPSVGFQIVTSGDAVAIDLVQNEGGAFATSPIPTTTAAVTRAADIIRLSGAAFTAVKGDADTSVIMQTQLYTNNTATYQTGLSTDAASGPVYPYWLATPKRASVYTPNAAAVLSAANTLDLTARQRMAMSFSTTKTAVVGSGGAVTTAATGRPNVAVTNVWLGSGAGTGQFLNGWLNGMSIYNQQIPDATLQAKSVVGSAY